MLSIEDAEVTCSSHFKSVSLDLAYQHSHPVEEAFLESRQAQVFYLLLKSQLQFFLHQPPSLFQYCHPTHTTGGTADTSSFSPTSYFCLVYTHVHMYRLTALPSKLLPRELFGL